MMHRALRIGRKGRSIRADAKRGSGTGSRHDVRFPKEYPV
jgi:hypothetical protein